MREMLKHGFWFISLSNNTTKQGKCIKPVTGNDIENPRILIDQKYKKSLKKAL